MNLVVFFFLFQDAINLTKTDIQPFIIGGGEIYSQTINMADKIELTKIYSELYNIPNNRRAFG